MPWTTFPRINVGAAPIVSGAAVFLRNTQVEHADLSQSSSIPPSSPIGAPPFGHAQIRESGTGAPGPVKAQHLTAESVSDSGTIAPGGRSRVALALTLDPGWHVCWVYAGDSGEPPSVKWSVPWGLSVGSMQYPAPSRLPLGPFMDYGYEGTAVFPFDLSTRKLHLEKLISKRTCNGLCAEKCAFPGRPISVSISA
jgi:DsbC/DsbD-like thiol-disulfide interchange protein